MTKGERLVYCSVKGSRGNDSVLKIHFVSDEMGSSGGEFSSEKLANYYQTPSIRAWVQSIVKAMGKGGQG